jgi:hypothetical protein
MQSHRHITTYRLYSTRSTLEVLENSHHVSAPRHILVEPCS